MTHRGKNPKKLFLPRAYVFAQWQALVKQKQDISLCLQPLLPVLPAPPRGWAYAFPNTSADSTPRKQLCLLSHLTTSVYAPAPCTPTQPSSEHTFTDTWSLTAHCYWPPLAEAFLHALPQEFLFEITSWKSDCCQSQGRPPWSCPCLGPSE